MKLFFLLPGQINSSKCVMLLLVVRRWFLGGTIMARRTEPVFEQSLRPKNGGELSYAASCLIGLHFLNFFSILPAVWRIGTD